ncbi:MAG: transcriptional regulator [Rhodocyclales bacterium GT-UBC]|nr:MAG: transcriptional regulator [Rhodocyclales bacterium GT-UBC]
MHTAQVFEYLKKHGQLLDSEIASATGIELEQVRISISQLSSQGEISRCTVTSFKNGQPFEAIQCRIFGYFPPATPGRKPATKVKD